MLKRSSMAPSPKPHPALHLFNLGIVFLSLSVLIAFLVSMMVNAFSAGLQQGVQSLAATLLPPLSISYIVVFTELFEGRNVRVPQFSLYFVSTIWMLILLLVMQDLVEEVTWLASPTMELLFSITLASLIWIYRGLSYRALRACCYGIVSGVLMYLISF
jgi:hypothetical protein